MKKNNGSLLIGAIGLLFLMTSCQESQVVNSSGSIAAGVKGVSAPGTLVSGLGVFETISGPVYVEAGGSPVSGPSGGQCLENGTWINPANNSTHPQHTHCTISAGGAVSLNITFSVYANDVQPKNGNRNLNFQETDGQDIDDAYIHYQKNQDRTRGEGIILATDDNANLWIIDLSQVNGAGNWFANNPLELTATNGIDNVQVVISW